MSGENANVFQPLIAKATTGPSTPVTVYGTRNITIYLRLNSPGTATVNVEVSPQSGTPNLWIPATNITAIGSNWTTALSAGTPAVVFSFSAPIVKLRLNVTALTAGTVDGWVQVET